MIYEITAVYRINATTPEDAVAIWLDDGPEVREGGGVLLHGASQLEVADMLAGHAHGALAEREGEDE
jgi:hypothetical protein